MAELPVPTGWFAVALSRDLPNGRVIAARLGAYDLVVWRDERGTASVASAWCPHLGAHLGYLGRVRGERLVCGFHGFAFGADGKCVATGYGGRVPPRAQLAMWPVAEVDGIVLAYHDGAGQRPSRSILPAGGTGCTGAGQPAPWAIPAADAAGITAARWRTLTFTGHPMEITENSVDVGHLRFVHGYAEVTEISRASADGPVLRARYAMTRPGRMFGVRVPTVRTTFDVAAYGLGFSRVELTVHTLRARVRLWVLPTPLGDGMVCLRIGAAAHRAGWLRGRLAAWVIRDFSLLGMVNDVAQDRRVWATKRHLPRPALAAGDGPIGLYRRWAGQFLPGVRCAVPPEEPARALPLEASAVSSEEAGGAPATMAGTVPVPGKTTVRSG